MADDFAAMKGLVFRVLPAAAGTAKLKSKQMRDHAWAETINEKSFFSLSVLQLSKVYAGYSDGANAPKQFVNATNRREDPPPPAQ